jgi:hypothetical protein
VDPRIVFIERNTDVGLNRRIDRALGWLGLWLVGVIAWSAERAGARHRRSSNLEPRALPR